MERAVEGVQDSYKICCWDILHAREDLILVAACAIYRIPQISEFRVTWVVGGWEHNRTRFLNITFVC
jgi:hypothetical protein